MNKDQVKGRIRKTKGQVKEITGKTLGNKKLEVEGRMEKVAGKSQAAYGDLKNKSKKTS